MDKYIVYHFAGARKLYNCPQLMFSADIKQATFYDKKEAIEQGLKDAEAGKLNPHSKARELYEKWL